MELTVLGASGTWPAEGNATSGYLVRHEGFNLWVDAGSGTLANLQKHIGIGRIDGILVSHEHPDHFVDVYPCFYARHYGELGTPHLPLYSGPDFYGVVSRVLSTDSRVVLSVAFDVRGVEPGGEFEIGPFRVRTEPMAHLGLKALGFRIEAGGAVLAYSGDTGPTHHLETLAKDADVMLSEATWQDRDDLLPFHMSSRQAADHARNAGARRLILTHIWPGLDRDTSIAQAAEEFDGPIEAAVEGMRIEVGK